ncbi:MAG TPA: hypothetical protein VK137_17625 [Planctomycetaceae bacterium]|nr:hypothetical protein [Planctomycetaceae bacterium]
MPGLSRRDFAKATLGSLLSYSLLETLFRKDAFADEIKPTAIHWLKELNTLASDVREQRITQVEWQKQIEALYRKIDLADLLQLVDFDALTRDLKIVDNGANSLRPRFPKVEGLPTEFVFGRQIFALKKGRSVVPHGHNNMATAFLILKGDMRGRLYDRLEDEESHILIKPTIDRSFTVGETSSISDYKDNVHWFQALSESAFIFNIHVLNVRPGSGESTGRVYLDPNGEKLSDGLIRAKKLGHKEAHDIYG